MEKSITSYISLGVLNYMLSSILLDYKTSSQEAEEAYCNTKRFIVNVHNDVRR